MNNRLIYKGQDITLDIIMKVERATSLIAEKEKCEFDDAYRTFVNSRTFEALEETATLLWAESAEFIVDDFYREKASKSIK